MEIRCSACAVFPGSDGRLNAGRNLSGGAVAASTTGRKRDAVVRQWLARPGSSHRAAYVVATTKTDSNSGPGSDAHRPLCRTQLPAHAFASYSLPYFELRARLSQGRARLMSHATQCLHYHHSRASVSSTGSRAVFGRTSFTAGRATPRPPRPRADCSTAPSRTTDPRRG